jgi:3-phenylpropionate/cinnamic acid dioxygenase small subunit
VSAGTPAPDAELRFAVEQFLHEEALALDEGRFDDWLALLDDDVRYVLTTRAPGAPVPAVDVPYLDEDAASLGQRVRRMAEGNAWAEVPPSRTQRLVTNVLLRPADEEGAVRVISALLLYRSRLEAEVELIVGRRDDVLRRTGDGPGFRLARRTITLATGSLPAKNVSVFL